jgi:poly(A) polymerase
MQDLADHPSVTAFLPHLRKLAAGRECYLVGGAIRDWLLNRALADFDFATAFDPSELARDFARSMHGHCFYLDEQRRQIRVVTNQDSLCLTFDFTPFRSATLVDDLLLRDFTVNAMALALDRAWTAEKLIDPAAGQQDLTAGILRIPSAAVLRSDPLRVVKGIRHAVELSLRIEPDTMLRMSQAVAGLSHVAVERIRHEMVRIISAPCETGRCFNLLMESGVGGFFWGEQFTRSDGALIRTQFRSLQFWKILEKVAPDLSGLLDKPVEAGLTRRSLLQWVFTLEALSPDCAAETARDWRFSRQAVARIEAAGRISTETSADFERVPLQRRPLLLWAAQYGPDPIDLLLAMAFCLNITPMASVEKILPPLAKILDPGEADFQVEDLVDGHYLRRQCGLQDGREIGRVLRELRQAEIYGRITGRSEAEALALELCDKKD